MVKAEVIIIISEKSAIEVWHWVALAGLAFIFFLLSWVVAEHYKNALSYEKASNRRKRLRQIKREVLK